MRRRAADCSAAFSPGTFHGMLHGSYDIFDIFVAQMGGERNRDRALTDPGRVPQVAG
jgi:hypothetical protein